MQINVPSDTFFYLWYCYFASFLVVPLHLNNIMQFSVGLVHIWLEPLICIYWRKCEFKSYKPAVVFFHISFYTINVPRVSGPRDKVFVLLSTSRTKSTTRFIIKMINRINIYIDIWYNTELTNSLVELNNSISCCIYRHHPNIIFSTI